MNVVEKYIYIVVIIILVAVISVGGTYIVMSNKNNNDNKEGKQEVINDDDNIISDSVKLIDVKQDGVNTIESLEITLNGKTKNMEIVYTADSFNDFCKFNIDGKYNDIFLYLDRCKSDFTGDLVTLIKDSFNEENYKIIKGKDNKNYLLIITNYDTVYVYNDNLELISKDAIEDSYENSNSAFTTSNYYTNVVTKLDTNKNVWYINENYCNKHSDAYGGCNVVFKVEDNKIYYLALNITELNYTENGYGILEERVYTINNNKLEYEVINSYEVLDIFNMT
ncbi:MAG: hypothetical protein NC483_00075 [Ruminococcus sp.]|nr:hypothetical protein [Ruminococcus sp.]